MTTLQQVELGVLGPLQIRQYGLPVAIPGAKPRAILTMLGLHGGSVVSADALAELLWGADPPRTAHKALQTHISALRRALGDGFVLTTGAGWSVSATEVDATRYQLSARLGREAAATGDVSGAVTQFDEALRLWRGSPELPDGPRGVAERTRWIESHAALVEDRAEALLATGRAAEIIGELEAAIAEAPLRERRWGHLMLALYRAGRQGEALGAYKRARSLLADQLGVDPGPDLRRLEAAIVAQDDALELPVSQRLSAVTRAVTFLLTDIEGSTVAWEADAEAMAGALARHDEIVEQTVTSRGGRLVKTRGEGDATFSVFDRPSAAATAAIELQEAMRREPWAPAEPIRIRVALHTGEVELRDGDYFGRAVNRAARLRSLAIGGQILCSGATAELVIDTLADDVVLTDLGMRALKNLTRPEHVFELRLDTADEARTPVTDVPIQRPDIPAVLAGPGPFVGRGRELEQLMSVWQTTLTDGAHAVLIAGEPGVGKTRLAGEWSAQAYDHGAVVLYGRCDEDLGAPYQPFAEALRTLVPCVGADRLRGLRGVEALLPLVPGLADVLPDLAAPPRADPDTERYALFDGVVAVLGVASAGAPVILILDDLHWAAKPTLLLLRHLLRFGEHARVQIIGTYRSTDLDRSHPLAAMLADLHRDGTAVRLALGGLDEDDVTAYVAESGYEDDDLARALASVTGGNPFFLIEALRHVDESGGRWDPSTLPQGVREAVSRRLSRLPAETNKALAAAAVIGSRFALDLVEQVVGTDLVDAFDAASQAGLVVEEPGGRYRFNHAIVRQSLLAELASVRRMRLHQRIAAVLETEPGADDELLAELAHHYFECAWAGNAAKAVDYCRRAGDQAIARLAYEGAAELYDRALHALEDLDDELPDRDDLHAELLIARCEALLTAGEVASAAGAVAQLHDAAGDSARLVAWGACFDGELSMLTDPERLGEIASEVGAAAETLAGLQDAAGEAKAHTVRAYCLGRLGRVGDCETALDQALTAARRADDHRRVNAVLAGAPLAALWGPNPVPRAGGRCLDVVRLLRITTGSPVVEATSTRCQAVLDAFRGRAAAGRQLIESARRSLSELGMRHALLEVDQFAGIIELVAGDPGSAEPHLRRACNGFRRMGLEADTAETAALLARACLALGRDAEADELCSESERLAGDALKAAIVWRTVRAQLLSRSGSHGEARQVAERAVALAENTDALVDHGDACLALATVLGAAGHEAEGRAAAERAAELYERKGAAALVEKARKVIGGREVPTAPATLELPVVELTDHFSAIDQLGSAVERGAWDEVEQLLAPRISVESRRKIVGFPRVSMSPSQWSQSVSTYHWVGMARIRHEPVAVRGQRLILGQLEICTADPSSGAARDEMLELVGLDEDGRIATHVLFDIEDLDAALAELDAQQARFEQEHPPAPSIEPDTACVRAVNRLQAAVDREAWDEVEQLLAPYSSVESRRKILGFSPISLQSSKWPPEMRRYLKSGMTRHRHEFVAVRGERLALIRMEIATEDESPGAPQVQLLRLFGLDDQGRIALQVAFDVEDLDAAVTELDALYARFEQGHPPTPANDLGNACARVVGRLFEAVERGDWAEIEPLYAPVGSITSHRKIVGFNWVEYRPGEFVDELRRWVREMRAVWHRYAIVGVRGEQLALVRMEAGAEDGSPGAPQDTMFQLFELDASGRIALQAWFDVEDIEAAFEELDSRYLAGEAAPYARTWSVIADVNSALNRGELFPTTADWVNIDHRRGTGFAPSDMTSYLHASWEQTPAMRIHVEAVHRLSELGAVVTSVSEGTSREGFDAEWRTVAIATVAGDLISRCEMFDEADLDAALARFGELSRPVPRLENTASRANARLDTLFAERRWDEMSALVAEDFRTEDRRRGLRREAVGRAAELDELQAIADLGVTTISAEVLAIRGDRVALSRSRFAGRGQQPDAFHTEILGILEIDSHGLAAAVINFDVDDIDSAFAELDARYLAGEAAPYARTWSVDMRAIEAVNRGELPNLTQDFVNIDHRKARAFPLGEMSSYLQAARDEVPDEKFYIEAVHRLSECGAVVTYVAAGTSKQGFDAEWRGITVSTVRGEQMNHIEMFDESDLDAALARFDELSRPAPRLENVATRADGQAYALYAANKIDEIGALYTDDIRIQDRRRGFRTEWNGRAAALANVCALADLGAVITQTPLALRGDRLNLNRMRFDERDKNPGAFFAESLEINEVDADGLMIARIIFEPDDLDTAFEELDARYADGEAAPYARTWSAILQMYASLNRRELPATTPDWVCVDHQRGRAITFSADEITGNIQDSWDQLSAGSVRIEIVHRLSDIGGVVTHCAKATAQQGFDVDWRFINVLVVDRGLIGRCEMFDEADLDAALARFDELSRPVRRLENAASQTAERYLAHFAARDWDAMAEVLAADHTSDDRRSVVNAGVLQGREPEIANYRVAVELGISMMKSDVLATRGQRLALERVRFWGDDRDPEAFTAEVLAVIEVNADSQIATTILFDIDDIDVACIELDARYLAGEAAPHAQAWSVVVDAYATTNRHEVPAFPPQIVEHRRLSTVEGDDLIRSLHAAWELTPDGSAYIEQVHRLSDMGAVVTHRARGTGQGDVEADWRSVNVLTVKGNQVNRCELFDEADLDAALARFEELSRPTPHLENAATRRSAPIPDAFNRRDADGFLGAVSAGARYEDRRKVLRDEGAVNSELVQEVLSVAEPGLRMAIEPIAIRGEHLALSRYTFRNTGEANRPIVVEALVLTEVTDGRLAGTVAFDSDDMDAAFEELDARYLAGEAAPHTQAWSLVLQTYAGFNRRELIPTSPERMSIDHRRGIASASLDAIGYAHAAWDSTPDTKAYIEAVHRLSDTGAVITARTFGTSTEGFDAEWRDIHLLTFQGGLGKRFELFDEADLDAALAHFDELSAQATRPQNTASRVYERFNRCFSARAWDTMAELLSDDHVSDDRRRVIGAGVRHGRGAAIADLQGVAERSGIFRPTTEVVATRGEQLALCHGHFTAHDDHAQTSEWDLLGVVEIDDDERIAAFIVFDTTDMAAAIAELESRSRTGES